MGHACCQLRAETRLLPFEQYPIVAEVPMMIQFLMHLMHLHRGLSQRIMEVQIILQSYTELELPVDSDSRFLLIRLRTPGGL